MATTAAGSVPPSRDEHPRQLRAEVERLRDEAIRQKELAHRRAGIWAKVDVALGFPAALLAGASGAAGMAAEEARLPAALAALASAGIAAGAASLRSERRRVANKRARQAWSAVEAGARMRLAQRRVDPAELGELFQSRQAALAAYEGEEPPPVTPAPGN